MKRRCILNVATGPYPEGQQRLLQSLDEFGFAGGRLIWTDDLPPGSPSHAESPYAFKLYAFDEAIRQGYEAILWCDASIQFIRSPDVIFDLIESAGHWLFHGGWNVGQWCTDEALPKLGVTREEAFEIKMTIATMFGLDVSRPEGRQILSWLRDRSEDGSFRGPWTTGIPLSNENKVYGHRHDQTALSVIVHKLGLKMLQGPEGLFEYFKSGGQSPGIVAVAKGMGVAYDAR